MKRATRCLFECPNMIWISVDIGWGLHIHTCTSRGCFGRILTAVLDPRGDEGTCVYETHERSGVYKNELTTYAERSLDLMSVEG